MIIVKLYGGVPFSYVDAFLNLLGLQGIWATDFGGVYWSIAYEVWFYVLIGSILCLGTNSRIKAIGMALLALCGMVFIKLPVEWFLILMLGMLLYFVKEKINLSRWQMCLCVVALVLLQCVTILGAESHVAHLPLNGIVNLGMVGWCKAILVGLLMVSLCNRQPEGKLAVLIEKTGNRWAPMTYCLYITHFTVLELYKQLFGQISHIDFWAVIVLVAVSGVCFAVGKCFYDFVEKPTARLLKDKLLR